MDSAITERARKRNPVQPNPLQSNRRPGAPKRRRGLGKAARVLTSFSLPHDRFIGSTAHRRRKEEGGAAAAAGRPMRKFQDSVKALEADIDHANALASEFLRDYDVSVIQMRMAYSAVAHFLVQWADCRLAGKLGLLKVMLYKVYADGSTAPPEFEREASIREFYGNDSSDPLTSFGDFFVTSVGIGSDGVGTRAGVIFPSLLQLPSGITELEERKQRRLCLKKFRKVQELSEVDTERERECGICLEVNGKVVLPDCAHTLCMRCFEDWNAKSKSCPFCRACLDKVKASSLWMFTDDTDIVDMGTLTRENIRRLFMYINKLPLVVLHVIDLDIYEFRIK